MDLTEAIEIGKNAAVHTYVDNAEKLPLMTGVVAVVAAIESGVTAAAPLIEKAVREQVIRELRYVDRLNSRAWQGNTAYRDESFRIAADYLEDPHIRSTGIDDAPQGP